MVVCIYKPWYIGIMGLGTGVSLGREIITVSLKLLAIEVLPNCMCSNRIYNI
jgi:hypothetical protein